VAAVKLEGKAYCVLKASKSGGRWWHGDAWLGFIKAMVAAKKGSINHCGIGIVRWTLVEMVWRLMIWQPQYPPVRSLSDRLGQRQTRQEALGGSSSTSFSDCSMAFVHRANHP
jgi:hypothetical protein